MAQTQSGDSNKKLTLKMLGVILAGAALGAPAVGWFLYEVKELSWGGGADSGKYAEVLPPVPAVKAKDRAFYCAEGVQKRYIGCN